MARPIKTGQIHSVSLKSVTFDLSDDLSRPNVELGELGTPMFTLTGLLRDANGRDIETEWEYGPDNIPEVGAALQLWRAITLAWRGKLGDS